MLGHRALRENSTIFQNNELHFVNSCSLVIIITNVIIVIAPYTLRVYLDHYCRALSHQKTLNKMYIFMTTVNLDLHRSIPKFLSSCIIVS